MSNTRFRYIVVLLLLIVTYLYTVFYKPSRVFDLAEFNRKIENFPRRIGDWRCKGDIVMSEIDYKALRPQAIIFRQYVNSGGMKLT